MPRTRITGLVEYYQWFHRVTYGNQQDINYTSHLVDSEVFVTADKNFAKVLNAVHKEVPGTARVAMVRKAKADVIEELMYASGLV